ncbi:MAG: glycosyltransferase [Candidatus Limnocylindria bacterium]
MDRVVGAVDAVAEGTGEDIIVQAAAFGLTPRYARMAGVVPHQRLDGWVQSARAIVTHGGPGSVMLALAAGKVPLVVPRDPARGEHVDDHQMRFVRWLATRRPIVAVFDVSDLADLLRGDHTIDAVESAAVAGVVLRLRELTGGRDRRVRK